MRSQKHNSFKRSLLIDSRYITGAIYGDFCLHEGQKGKDKQLIEQLKQSITYNRKKQHHLLP